MDRKSKVKSMSLTIFVSNKDSHVRVLQWFGTVMGCALVSPCGPLLHFEFNEFQRVGLDLIRQHFIDFRTKRLTKETVSDVFSTRSEKKTLGGQRAVGVVEERDGRLRLIPIEIEKCSLIGLKYLPDEKEQFVLVGASQEDFWESFNRALASAVSL